MADDVNSAGVFDRAAEFVSEMWSLHDPRSEMHVGDLAWGTFHRWPSALGSLRLWPDTDGQTQVLTMFDGTRVCDLVVRPGRDGLDAAALALDWAENTALAAADSSEAIELRVGRRLQSAEVIELLRARGFERLSIGVPAMSRTIAAGDVAPPSTPDGYAVRELHTDDLASRVRAFNNATSPVARKMSDEFGCAAHGISGAIDLLARVDGRAAACGSLQPVHGVGWLGGAATLPEFRRRGLQRTMLQMRIGIARLDGHEFVAATAVPNSPSMRNLERAGLTLIDTQTVWTRQP